MAILFFLDIRYLLCPGQASAGQPHTFIYSPEVLHCQDKAG
jgi:hypothetical protein